HRAGDHRHAGRGVGLGGVAVGHGGAGRGGAAAARAVRRAGGGAGAVANTLHVTGCATGGGALPGGDAGSRGAVDLAAGRAGGGELARRRLLARDRGRDPVRPRDLDGAVGHLGVRLDPAAAGARRALRGAAGGACRGRRTGAGGGAADVAGGGAGRLPAAGGLVAVDVRARRARRRGVAVGQRRRLDRRTGEPVDPGVLLVGLAVDLGRGVGLAVAAGRLARGGAGARALRAGGAPAAGARGLRRARAGAGLVAVDLDHRVAAAARVVGVAVGVGAAADLAPAAGDGAPRRAVGGRLRPAAGRGGGGRLLLGVRLVAGLGRAARGTGAGRGAVHVGVGDDFVGGVLVAEVDPAGGAAPAGTLAVRGAAALALRLVAVRPGRVVVELRGEDRLRLGPLATRAGAARVAAAARGLALGLGLLAVRVGLGAARPGAGRLGSRPALRAARRRRTLASRTGGLRAAASAAGLAFG